MSKRCPVCEHQESEFITALLRTGIGPRAITRRVGGVSRVSLDAMDASLGLGDVGEEAALLCFQMARQKDLEHAVAHAITVREDWAETYEDIILASQEPDLEAGDRFEILAQPAPTKQDLLGGRQSDLNLYGQLR